MFPLLLALLHSQAPADTLTLEGALVHARAARGTAAGVAALVDLARGESRALALVPNPLVQFEHDASSPTNKLTVTQPIDWIVQRGAARGVGRALVNRAVADSQQVLAELGREVRRAFHAALAADATELLAAEQVRLADSIRTFARRRLDAGDISQLDLEQVVQEGGRARVTYSRAREAARVARITLGRAVGWRERAPPVPTGGLDDGLDDPAIAVSPVSPSEHLPPIARAVADSAAAATQLQLAHRSRLPIPALIIGREWGPAWSTSAGSIVGFSLPLPLFNQGGERSALAAAAADRAIAATHEARLAAVARVAQAEERLREATWRARFARDSLAPAASRLREGTVRLFDAGQVGVLDVFEALRAEREVAQSTITELLAYQEARAEWLAAMGAWQ